MTDPALPSAAAASGKAARHRQRRRAAERRFRLYGQMAILLAVSFLTVLLVSIGLNAQTAFSRHMLVLDVQVPADAMSDETGTYDLTALNQNVQAALIEVLPDGATSAERRSDLFKLTTRLAALPAIRSAQDAAEPGADSRTLKLALSDDLDLFLKGGVTSRQAFAFEFPLKAGASSAEDSLILTADERDVKRLEAFLARPEAGAAETLIRMGSDWFELNGVSGTSLDVSQLTHAGAARSTTPPEAARALSLATPSRDRNVSNLQIAWVSQLKSDGVIRREFNASLFTHADSIYPELAGAAAAIVGSLLTMLVTALFALPVGILAAIYLEEFAPRGFLTGLIEVNINNLAAVPSIIFGLLGASVFLNTFGMPRSVPLVGGLVLGLLVLPTIIIAARAALNAVPPSVRTAALGLGASPSQAVFHHVLPLAAPGIMTGAILAMARALGETAPLLLIGMVAFVNEVPGGPTDEATTLPVLIFKWFSGAERAWEPMTAAVIIILLSILVLMNVMAVIVRARFERKW